MFWPPLLWGTFTWTSLTLDYWQVYSQNSPRHPAFSKGWKHDMEMCPVDPLPLYDSPESWLLSLCLIPVSPVAFPTNLCPAAPIDILAPQLHSLLATQILVSPFSSIYPFPFKFAWGLDLTFLLLYALVYKKVYTFSTLYIHDRYYGCLFLKSFLWLSLCFIDKELGFTVRQHWVWITFNNCVCGPVTLSESFLPPLRVKWLWWSYLHCLSLTAVLSG